MSELLMFKGGCVWDAKDNTFDSCDYEKGGQVCPSLDSWVLLVKVSTWRSCVERSSRTWIVVVGWIPPEHKEDRHTPSAFLAHRSITVVKPNSYIQLVEPL